jgi:hypothetical protein
MQLLSIIIFSVALYFAAKRLKFADTSFVTCFKTSMVSCALIYILEYFPYINFLGFIFVIIHIKYFYKVDFKKAMHVWFVSLGITILILLAATLPYDLYKLYKSH